MADLTTDQKYALMTANLAETLNPEILKDVVYTQNRSPVIYWGTAITGRPHCAYFVPMLKIAQFLRAGCRVKILLADLHGFLDAAKSQWELLDKRTEYYRFVVESMLSAIGVSLSKLEFVRGRTYQLTPDYSRDLLRLSTETSEHDAKKAGSEVVKQMDHSPLSGLLYPLMQTLDEQYLGVDAQFGGVDQRKIFTFAKDALPKLGYRQRAHLMNPMVPGLTGGKMSASDPKSKIDVLDGPEVVRKKIRSAYAEPMKVEGNGMLAFAEHVLFPASELREGKARLVVERVREGLEPLVYGSVREMEEDYRKDVLTPQLLKLAVTQALNELLAPIQMAFNQNVEIQKLVEEAYPPEGKPVKEKKKHKKGGKKKGPETGDGDEAQNGTEDGEPADSTASANGVPIR